MHAVLLCFIQDLFTFESDVVVTRISDVVVTRISYVVVTRILQRPLFSSFICHQDHFNHCSKSNIFVLVNRNERKVGGW